MFTFRFGIRSSLSMGLAALGAAATIAHAAATVDQTSNAAAQQKMAACKQEFSSLRDMCASEAGWGQVIREDLSPEQRQTLNQEESRYRSAVTTCNSLLGNNRPICVSRAATPSAITGM